jgi:hypothetical protein
LTEADVLAFPLRYRAPQRGSICGYYLTAPVRQPTAPFQAKTHVLQLRRAGSISAEVASTTNLKLLQASSLQEVCISFAEYVPEEDQFGRLAYLATCKELGVVPVSQVRKAVSMAVPELQSPSCSYVYALPFQQNAGNAHFLHSVLISCCGLNEVSTWLDVQLYAKPSQLLRAGWRRTPNTS